MCNVAPKCPLHLNSCSNISSSSDNNNSNNNDILTAAKSQEVEEEEGRAKGNRHHHSGCVCAERREKPLPSFLLPRPAPTNHHAERGERSLWWRWRTRGAGRHFRKLSPLSPFSPFSLSLVSCSLRRRLKLFLPPFLLLVLRTTTVYSYGQRLLLVL